MDIPLQEIAGPYLAEGATPQMTEIEWTAVDDTESHTFPIASSAGTLLLLTSTQTGTSIQDNVTIHSSPNKFGREADIEELTVMPGEVTARIFKRHGWENFPGSGVVEFEVSTDAVGVAAIRL